jgi:hypothetical protein
VINAGENRSKLFILLPNGDRNRKERLLLPDASDRSALAEKIDEELTTKAAQEITLPPDSIPRPTGYIKYPIYDFF